MMPGLWFAGALLYMGLGWVYAGYLVVKMAVIIGAHSDVAWDKPLYRIKGLSPVMWVVERTISTPALISSSRAVEEIESRSPITTSGTSPSLRQYAAPPSAAIRRS